MSLPNVLIAWGVRFGSTSYTLRVDVDGTAEDLTFPLVAFGASLSTTADYFLVDDQQKDDLCRLLEDTLSQHSLINVATVSLTSGWRVSVELKDGGTAIQLLWSHVNTTLDGAVWGFDADTAASGTVTAANLPQSIWRPQRAIWEDSRNRQPIVGGVARSISGQTRVIQIATPAKDRTISFWRIPKARILTEFTASTEPSGAFEYAWVNSISKGHTFRVYEDEADRDHDQFEAYRTRTLADPLRRNSDRQIHWNVELSAVRTSAALSYFTSATSFDLDGTNDYAEVPHHADLNAGSAFTVSIWFKRDTAFTAAQTLCGKWLRNTQNEWRLFTPNASLMGLYIANALTDSGGNYVHWAVPTADAWHQVVAVYNAGACTVYMDQVSQTLTTVGTIAATVATGTGNLSLGCDDNGSSQYFGPGNLDEFAFWNRALTPSEVAQTAASGAPANLRTLTPTCWLRCGDEDQYPNLRDWSGNNHDGHLINTANGDFVEDAP